METNTVTKDTKIVEINPLNSLVTKNAIDLSDPLSIRNFILYTESLIGQREDAIYGDNDICPLVHRFAPGVYCREISIPAGMFIIGKIHKHEHHNILSKGRVSVLTESGGIEMLEGYKHIISAPGTKRMLYTHTDTVWTTIHATDLTDLEEIEDHVIAKSYEEYTLFIEQENQKELS